MKEGLSIVIPAYNEEASLRENLSEVVSFCEENGFYLIVVNDGSKDQTKHVCQELMKGSSFCQVISHKVNRGYGGAIKTGVEQASTKYVITIDADGQHNLSDVSKLYKEIVETDADMIVGSRIGQKEASFFRAIGKKLIRLIANFLVKLEVKDINSGMKIYNAGLAKKYIQLCPNTMAYSDTILLVFVFFRHLVIERPITINQRTAGESTINVMTAVGTVKEIFNMVILFNPIKVFTSIAIIVLLLSIAWGIPIVLKGDGISVGTMLGIMTGFLLLILGLLAEQVSQIRRSQVR